MFTARQWSLSLLHEQVQSKKKNGMSIFITFPVKVGLINNTWLSLYCIIYTNKQTQVRSDHTLMMCVRVLSEPICTACTGNVFALQINPSRWHKCVFLFFCHCLGSVVQHLFFGFWYITLIHTITDWAALALCVVQSPGGSMLLIKPDPSEPRTY